jgi:hypothetical protein
VVDLWLILLSEEQSAPRASALLLANQYCHASWQGSVLAEP